MEVVKPFGPSIAKVKIPEENLLSSVTMNIKNYLLLLID